MNRCDTSVKKSGARDEAREPVQRNNDGCNTNVKASGDTEPDGAGWQGSW